MNGAVANQFNRSIIPDVFVPKLPASFEKQAIPAKNRNIAGGRRFDEPCYYYHFWITTRACHQWSLQLYSIVETN
ncbi:hypothetical protein CEXT_618191 [Caerostris extrusa]|uniref:Uncharacterized protein n=1 Tax=Caerostris extrusa TaxID=172846 RepID=A0AAV4MK52_CAEEX|nr:hypothetical protein CEXT_618191 [Caerostris extrusa]